MIFFFSMNWSPADEKPGKIISLPYSFVLSCLKNLYQVV
jgi:hypothetical protein